MRVERIFHFSVGLCLCLLISGQPGYAAVLDPANLILMATVHTRGQYDNAGLGTWNGAPLSPTNQPTYDQDQLSADWNFYVDPAHHNDLFVYASNVLDTQYGFLVGPGFDFVALTGFNFSMKIPLGALVQPASFSNQWATPGEALLGPVSGESAALTTTPGWNLVSVSGGPVRRDYSIATPVVDDALTHFSTVTGETRIFDGAAFEFEFNPVINLFRDANFGSLQADADFGLDRYVGAGEITYLHQRSIPEPSGLSLLVTGAVLTAAVGCTSGRPLQRRRISVSRILPAR